MIDPAHPAVSWYLYISAAAFALLFTLPLMVAPLRWARMLRWNVSTDDTLAVYLGRCLGAASGAIVYVVVRAAGAPAAHPLVFELMIVSAALIAIMHVIGALEGKQPWIETAEIPFWAAVAIVAGLVYRSL